MENRIAFSGRSYGRFRASQRIPLTPVSRVLAPILFQLDIISGWEWIGDLNPTTQGLNVVIAYSDPLLHPFRDSAAPNGRHLSNVESQPAPQDMRLRRDDKIYLPVWFRPRLVEMTVEAGMSPRESGSTPEHGHTTAWRPARAIHAPPYREPNALLPAYVARATR
jgi:hypothetical protein